MKVANNCDGLTGKHEHACVNRVQCMQFALSSCAAEFCITNAVYHRRVSTQFTPL
jgi:hypothetical protein